ncbi:EF-hand domain-containing protein [Rivibacter subsaxonicus]|uniref:EF-hand domain-containing protein n=1 Tax=Rivibacter subsaxonicus TaxID=457575 RepID=A0A4Q7VZ39_9BURK|nr:EF-hand domain-containing protein [Rivibacter subsaxonicus]RZU02094.1 hypothetical protein EV670_0113 [Rivibacter subsaxonicus]
MQQLQRQPLPRRAAARRLLAFGLALGLGGPVVAAERPELPPALFENAQRGPWVPPASLPRGGALPEPTRGAALQAQAEARLRADFEAAAAAHGGRLTRAQAEAAGLGYVAREFERIDRRGAGSVRFEDLRQFARQRAAEMAR